MVITFSDAAVEQLQAARAYAEAIVDTVREGLVVLDADLRVLSANRSFYEMFHLSKADTEGRLLHELGNGLWDIPQLRTLLELLLPEKRELTDFEVEHDFETLGRRTMMLNGRLLTPDTGKHLFLLAIEDITARKQAEHRLRERKAEIAHAQRLHVVGEIVAGLAHNLGQPLAAITNEIGACIRFVQAKRIDPPTLLEALEHAGSEAEHAGRLLQRLRQVAEKCPADFQAVDLRALVNDSIALVRGEAQRLQIRLQVDVEQQPLLVNASVIQITQVLVNLLRNAVAAIEVAGGERREITVQCKRTAPSTAEVAVHDTGIGLGQTDDARLFEAFVTTKPQGLGMGLAISRRIVEAHEGRIWAEQPAHTGGATVRFTLPLISRHASSTRGSR